jgi:hypothetical protein
LKTLGVHYLRGAKVRQAEQIHFDVGKSWQEVAIFVSNVIECA